MDDKNKKTGIMNFGYVENLKTYIDELNSRIGTQSEKIEASAFNRAFDFARENNKLDYLDKFGKKISESQALYVIYATGVFTDQGSEIFAFFERKNINKTWQGIFFATRGEIRKKIDEACLFVMGNFYFDDPATSFKKGFEFLDEVAVMAIPEKWTYKNHRSKIPHPILKSYLENTFVKVMHDRAERLLVSDSRGHVIFNSGLLDKFFHPIFIILRRKEEDGAEKFYNPCVARSMQDYHGIKVDGHNIRKPSQLPAAVEYFSDISEVVFNPQFTIDRAFYRFEHIVTDRKDRFPEEYQQQSTEQRARALDAAIDYAVALAERNYKLVVPQYRPDDDLLQLLMPIYLKGSYCDQPDMALVLDLCDELYIPQTILTLDMAYQNARLIAKPDSFWLNPDEE
jgi:hypothetical protein